jgi:chromosome segregation ATPase
MPQIQELEVAVAEATRVRGDRSALRVVELEQLLAMRQSEYLQDSSALQKQITTLRSQLQKQHTDVVSLLQERENHVATVDGLQQRLVQLAEENVRLQQRSAVRSCVADDNHAGDVDAASDSMFIANVQYGVCSYLVGAL